MKKQTFLSFVAACAMLTGSLQAQAADRQFKDFSLILNNENGTILTADEMAAQDTDFAFGISVSDEGTVSRIATDPAAARSAYSTTAPSAGAPYRTSPHFLQMRTERPLPLSSTSFLWATRVAFLQEGQTT